MNSRSFANRLSSTCSIAVHCLQPLLRYVVGAFLTMQFVVGLAGKYEAKALVNILGARQAQLYNAPPDTCAGSQQCIISNCNKSLRQCFEEPEEERINSLKAGDYAAATLKAAQPPPQLGDD